MAIILCRPNGSFVVEEFINGQEFRVQLVAKQPVFALERRPQSVVGDGIATLQELISARIADRDRNPLTAHRSFDQGQADRQLAAGQWNYASVVPAAEVVPLATHSVVGDVTDNIDIRETVEPALLSLAKAAGRAVGVKTGSVDIRRNAEGKYYVLEVNAKSGIDMYSYPAGGSANWVVPLAIIKENFPHVSHWLQPNVELNYLSLAHAFQDGTDDVIPADLFSTDAAALNAA